MILFCSRFDVRINTTTKQYQIAKVLLSEINTTSNLYQIAVVLVSEIIRHQADIKLDNHNIYFQHRISLILLTNFYPESTLTALVRVQTEFVETNYFWTFSWLAFFHSDLSVAL